MRIREVAIGAVIYASTLTTVIRRDRMLSRIEEGRLSSIEAAAHVLMQMRIDLQRDGDAAIFIEANHVPGLGAVYDMLREHDPHGVVQLVHGLGPAHTFAIGGVEYANRRSELIDKYLHQLHGQLLVPPDEKLAEELLAFGVLERDGKITYPSPVEVADKIQRYPARALAAVLSTIPAPQPGARKQKRKPFSYDPYKNI